MKRIILPFALALSLIVGVLQAQQNMEPKKNNLFEELSSTDSVSHATVRIHQDKRIEQLMTNRRHSGSSDQTVSGFRVQVFSSNVQRSAKTEAFRIEREIKDGFPDEAVYVNYSSPFWKVRVGDFRTQAEAQKLRSQLKETFPKLKSEIYIVREQILLSK